MRNRTVVELNHDYCPHTPEQAKEWVEFMITYMTSGDPRFLPKGVTFKHMRHHSEPDPMAGPSPATATATPEPDADLLDALKAMLLSFYENEEGLCLECGESLGTGAGCESCHVWEKANQAITKAEKLRAGEQNGQGCGQSQRDARLLEGIENQSIVYYGPHECDLCGAKNIIRGSVKDGFGDIRFDWPINEPFIYPNHNWIWHKCAPREGSTKA